MAKAYALHIPKAIEERLAQCPGTMRQAINKRLLEIAREASRRVVATPPRTPRGPPHRFYVLAGYRVFYRLDRGKRHVVVLDLRPEAA